MITVYCSGRLFFISFFLWFHLLTKCYLLFLIWAFDHQEAAAAGAARSHEAAPPLRKITASLGGNITLEEFSDLHVFFLPSRQPSFSSATTKPFYPPALPASSRPVSRRAHVISHRTNHLPHHLLISHYQRSATSSDVSYMFPESWASAGRVCLFFVCLFAWILEVKNPRRPTINAAPRLPSLPGFLLPTPTKQVITHLNGTIGGFSLPQDGAYVTVLASNTTVSISWSLHTQRAQWCHFLF